MTGLVVDNRRWLGVARACLVAIGLCAVLAVGASPAQAHTDLQSSTPASGARLDAAPTGLELRFTENISPDFAQLALIRGDEPVQRLEGKVRGPVLTAGVPPASGTRGGRVAWEVSYRVVSADGHPITGTVEFTAPIGAAPPPSPPTPGPSETPAAETDGTAGGDASETERAGAAAGADQRNADDPGSSPSMVTIAAIVALALAVTATATVLAVRRRSERPR